MYAMAGLTDGSKHVVELLLSAHEQAHAVVVSEVDTIAFQLPVDKCIGGLCRCTANATYIYS